MDHSGNDKRPRIARGLGNYVDLGGVRYCFGGLLAGGLVAGGVAGLVAGIVGLVVPAGLEAPAEDGGGAGTPDLML